MVTVELDKIEQLQARPVRKLSVDNISALILKGYNQSQIAKILNVSVQAVNQYIASHQDVLRPLVDNTDMILAQRFKRHAIDYLDSIDEHDIKKASLLQRMTAVGIATEKYRLLADKSTENVAVDGVLRDVHSTLFKQDRKKIPGAIPVPDTSDSE